jgi:hypothetical protein
MKLKSLPLITAAALLIGCSLLPGCMTSKVTTVTHPTGGTGTVTNTVTVVNTNNLILDASVIQAAVATGVSVAIQKDPSTIPAFKDAQMALDGVLNGSNTNTTAQVLALLGNDSNPTIASEVTPLISVASSLEQQLLAKYGSGVAGQISLAIAKAVDAGLIVALQGK